MAAQCRLGKFSTINGDIAIFYVLAAEAESAGMYLAFRESWEYIN
jgi:hypothetical protein